MPPRAEKILKRGRFAMARRGSVRLVMLAAGLAFAVISTAAAAQTADEGVFVVQGVVVDRTADTATAARELALAEGQRRAYGRLMARLVPAGALGVPELDGAGIGALIRDFDVAEEKTSLRPLSRQADDPLQAAGGARSPSGCPRSLRRDAEQAGPRPARLRFPGRATAVGRPQSLARGLVRRPHQRWIGADRRALWRLAGRCGHRRDTRPRGPTKGASP